MKHQLKTALRRGYARLLFHTGLHRVVDRLMPRRLTVLAGHCVEDEEANGHLPRDMVVRRETLERILTWFSRRYRWVTVTAGLDELESSSGPSLLALSMDDGYRDNLRTLVPLLEECGVPATVYLETRVLDERRVNWSHKLFWCQAQRSIEAFAEAYAGEAQAGAQAGAQVGACAAEVAAVVAGGERVAYRVKRILKYDADGEARDRAVDAVFRAWGGDEAALAERVFLTWDEARALRDHGVELGAHTVTHPVLSRLDAAQQAAEIGGSAQALERELGARPATLAYPFGRRWDFDDTSASAVREAGYRAALTSHSGTIGRVSDPVRLRRIAFDDTVELSMLVAEACGGFDLLRRVGLDWSE